MMTTLYVRPGLLATRTRIADPGLLVDLWLDRLIDLHQGYVSGEPAEDAYDLLAGWARLQRTLPDLLAATGRLDEWHAVASAIQQQGPELVKLALQLPNPAGWLDEARRYQQALDLQEADLDLPAWAERLLTDLDDADLVAWTGQKLGQDITTLEALQDCGRWLEENAALFAPCGVYVQALGMTLRNDLPQHDLDLAWTADKYVVLLDVLEEIEPLLTFPQSPVFPQEAARELFGRSSGTVILRPTVPAAHDWSGLAPVAALAARGSVPTRLAHRDWLSPDGQFTATLVFDPQGTGPIRVNFYRSGESSVPLTRGVELAGVTAEVDERGNADFPRQALDQARREAHPLTLKVGEEFWQPLLSLETP